MEKIVDSRQKGKKMEYLVKWKGYPSAENTWEPSSNLEDVMDMVEAFEAKSSGKAVKRGPGRPPKSASPSEPHTSTVGCAEATFSSSPMT